MMMMMMMFIVHGIPFSTECFHPTDIEVIKSISLYNSKRLSKIQCHERERWTSGSGLLCKNSHKYQLHHSSMGTKMISGCYKFISWFGSVHISFRHHENFRFSKFYVGVFVFCFQTNNREQTGQTFFLRILRLTTVAPFCDWPSLARFKVPSLQWGKSFNGMADKFHDNPMWKTGSGCRMLELGIPYDYKNTAIVNCEKEFVHCLPSLCKLMMNQCARW